MRCLALMRLLATALLLGGLAWPAAQAQITVVDSSSIVAQGAGTTQIVVPRPSGTAQGDLLLAQVAINQSSTTTITPPASWTLVNRTDASSTTLGQAVYSYLVGPLTSEPASYTWTISPGGRSVGAILAVRGAETTPVASASAAATNASTITAPSVTTTTASNLLVAFVAIGDATVTIGTPSGMTAQVAAAGSNDKAPALALFSQAQATAGASGNKLSSLSKSGASATANGAGVLLALQPVSGGGSVNAANFDCLETGLALSAGQRSPLYTKLAGVGFSFDVLALKSDGTQETGYVASGASARTVTVELFDASSPPASCAAYSGAVASQSLSFGSTDQGRKTTASFNLGTAYGKLACRVTEAATSTQGCSTDSFTVRPLQLSLSSSVGTAANADATGSSASATPAIKAGTAFTLVADSGQPGYNGTPQVDTSKIEWPGAPAGGRAGGVGTISGSFSTAASAASGNGARGDAFSYSEVGYFRFQPQGVFDAGFTALSSDAANGDCTNDFSNTLVGGKYGCKFGNTAASSYLGRFMPHHFAVQSPAFSAACTAGGFSYMGQPFTLTASVVALNASGVQTQNYSGSFGTGLVTPQLENADDGVAISSTRLGGLGSPSWSGGAYAFTASQFARAAAADGPYDALAIGLTVSAETALAGAARPTLINRDMDAAGTSCTADTSGSSNGSCSAVTLSTTKLRFGRLRVSNVRASELRDTEVPLTAEYWNGSQFVVNSLDHCTTLPAGSIRLQSYSGGVTAANMPQTSVSLGGAFSAGKGSFVLKKPLAAPGRGSLGLCADLGADAPALCTGGPAALSWLQGNWSGASGGAFDDDPSARASYGGYRAGDNLIFLRELY